MDPVNQAYAEDCFGWKCTICGLFAKDQVELEMQLIENEKILPRAIFLKSVIKIVRK